jgi:hypothetical protein
MEEDSIPIQWRDCLGSGPSSISPPGRLPDAVFECADDMDKQEDTTILLVRKRGDLMASVGP